MTTKVNPDPESEAQMWVCENMGLHGCAKNDFF